MDFDKQLNDTMYLIHRRLQGEVNSDLVDVLDSLLQMVAVIRSEQFYAPMPERWDHVDSYTPPSRYYDVEYVMLLGPYAEYEAESFQDALKEQVGQYSKHCKQWLSASGIVLDPQPTHWRKLL